MAVSPFEVIAGPARVWLAAVGATMPGIGDDDAAVLALGFVELGRTDGGVSVGHNESIELIMVDQVTGPIKAIRTEETIVVTFSFANLTLENYAKVLNDVSVASVVSQERSITLYQGPTVAQFAMLIRGDSPYEDDVMQFELPVVSQTGSPSMSFTRDDKSVLETEWTTLEDQAAGTDAAKYGTLRAADSSAPA
ncbi:hypothetical protein LCGC14_1868020 [marine sediment metagenome]|uniref:Uncharacterized protein n=1 Tax=marine sediment metagenome TaxID=412755 RepID=A0A0F9G5V0_9ZZZZ